LYRLGAWLRWYWRSQSDYHIHSPFVFGFIEQVLRARATANEVQALKKIALYRQQLIKDRRIISMAADYGAGVNQVINKQKNYTLGSLVMRASCSAAKGKLLYRICRYTKPVHVLELGTHAGISASYLIQALRGNNATFIGVEGNPGLAGVANETLSLFSPSEVAWQIKNARFDDVLEGLDTTVDLVYLDGHHTFEATCGYVRRLVPMLSKGGVLILDDIYWSKEMERAWKWVCELEAVTVSIDLFVSGVCFIHRPQAKEHFVFRP
jgi:predicted O-methyltransferase YrrM